jgi:hypothetical protein
MIYFLLSSCFSLFFFFDIFSFFLTTHFIFVCSFFLRFLVVGFFDLFFRVLLDEKRG